MPQKQIGRVEEFFTLRTGARVRGAPNQQQGVWDGLKDSSAFAMLLPHEHRGANPREKKNLDHVDLFLCPASLFQLVVQVSEDQCF